MNPQNPQPPTNPVGQPPQQGPRNPLEVMQKGEREIFHLTRHPFGLIAIYAFATLVLAGVAVMLFGVLPAAAPDQKSNIYSIGSALYLVVVVLVAVAAFIANKVYWGNAWVLTSDSITHIRQTSLFDRQQSQLSLENIEDVTAEQNGILAHIFGYGVLKCETAGEHSKFIFSYCPNPSYYAQQVLKAREEFAQGIHYEGNEEHTHGVNINTAG